MRTPNSSCSVRIAVALALALSCAGHAQAHLVSTGMGPFYDGIGHFFLSPDDIIAALALALLAGQRGPAMGGWAIWTLPAAWMAGGLIGVLSGAPVASAEMSSALSFIVLGVLVAADLRLTVSVVVLLALILGMLHGFFNGISLRGAGVGAAMLQFGGIGLVLFLIVLHVSDVVQSLKRPVARIVVRVAGSWIAASGLLLLGWWLHGRGI